MTSRNFIFTNQIVSISGQAELAILVLCRLFGWSIIVRSRSGTTSRNEWQLPTRPPWSRPNYGINRLLKWHALSEARVKRLGFKPLDAAASTTRVGGMPGINSTGAKRKSEQFVKQDRRMRTVI